MVRNRGRGGTGCLHQFESVAERQLQADKSQRACRITHFDHTWGRRHCIDQVNDLRNESSKLLAGRCRPDHLQYAHHRKLFPPLLNHHTEANLP